MLCEMKDKEVIKLLIQIKVEVITSELTYKAHIKI